MRVDIPHGCSFNARGVHRQRRYSLPCSPASTSSCRSWSLRLIETDKLGVVRLALELRVPIEETWSCFHAAKRTAALRRLPDTRFCADQGRPSRPRYAGGTGVLCRRIRSRRTPVLAFRAQRFERSRLDSDANAASNGRTSRRACYDGTIFQKLNEVGAAYRLFRESGEKLEILGDIICRHGFARSRRRSSSSSPFRSLSSRTPGPPAPRLDLLQRARRIVGLG